MKLKNTLCVIALSVVTAAVAAQTGSSPVLTASDNVRLPIVDAASSSDVSVSCETLSAPVPQAAATVDNKSWHLEVSPYLWFAGVHGTVGVLGRTASIHTSAADVLSHFNIGLMGAAEARKGRFVVPLDFMWIKLSDDKALPEIIDAGTASIKVKMTQTILTPKAGYRVVDNKMFKADALVGFRYWHLGDTFTLQPAGTVSYYEAANWVDVAAGAKFLLALSPKAVITVSGDAGGDGANSEYQVAGLMAYRIKRAIQLQGGWRYLDVHYLGGSSFVYDVAQTGLILGVTITLK